MRKITSIIALLLAFVVGANAQESTKGFNSSLSIASQNWTRGVAYTVAPAFEGDIHYRFCKGFALGAESAIALNEVEGYGNELNTYMTITSNELSLTFKDYFHFYGNGADANLYGDWGKNTRHFIEASFKYKKEKYYGQVAYTLIQNEAIEKNGVYIEAGYKLNKNTEVSAGYITDYSALNWREKGGITHIGISNSRDLKVSDSWTTKVKAGIYVNPSYKDVSDYAGISAVPVNCLVSISF